ncbi:GNAT family N-acetyltransferase [Nesterenkonia sp. HG001]|uniref:GNAT family N-acetyltransferase n=1 Tax=Nesterenkonia sp. HG001 TaxID=2983207 RepID=UPI002AC6228A|nr:GNAT family N-acetyltransferase [Nesterenkonia sp. HG001]MDZ5076090.1 GNAT family N-acetyltransferase [Nesterenkonia sp. HG001]
MGELLDDLAAARAAWTGLQLRDWYAQDRLLAQLRTALEPDAERLENPEFGAEVRDLVQADESAAADDVHVDVEDPLLWADRRITHDDGGWSVIGIRFRGRDLTCPFVDVIASSLSPTPENIRRIVTEAAEDLKEFRPLTARLTVGDPDSGLAEVHDASGIGPSAVDQYLVAGLIRGINHRTRVASYRRVSLEPMDPTLAAARVAEIYAAHPEGTRWATPAGPDELQEASEDGALFEIFANGEPAGVVSAPRDDDHGLSGHLVQEICLDEDHRGRGYGPAVLQRLCEELPHPEPGTVLWGSIHPENVPSLRNAHAVGRTTVGGQLWVAPEGLPGMPAALARPW